MNKRNHVDIKELDKFMVKSEGIKDVRDAMKNLSTFEDIVKKHLNLISEFFLSKQINKSELYESMDSNKDGTVDRDEFIA